MGLFSSIFGGGTSTATPHSESTETAVRKRLLDSNGNLKQTRFNFANGVGPANYTFANKSDPYKFTFGNESNIKDMYGKKQAGIRSEILGQSNDALTQAGETIGTRDSGARAFAAASLGRDTQKSLAQSKNDLDISEIADILKGKESQQTAQAGENFNHAQLLGQQQQANAADRLDVAKLKGTQQQFSQGIKDNLLNALVKFYGIKQGAKTTTQDSGILSKISDGVSNISNIGSAFA